MQVAELNQAWRHCLGFPHRLNLLRVAAVDLRAGPLNGIGPFIRRPTGVMTDYFGITELTADALVTYKISKLTSANAGVDLEQVIVRVSDRRDAQTLATLQYVWDRQNRKLCGTTSDGVLDELSFIKKLSNLN